MSYTRACPTLAWPSRIEPEVDPRSGKSLEVDLWRLPVAADLAQVQAQQGGAGGGIVILLFYLSALFAPFLAPYGLTTRFTKYIYMPPQRIHFFQRGQAPALGL